MRSYLDVNCAQCHRPGMVAQVAFDARYDTPLAQQGLVGAPVRWPNVTHVADLMIHPERPDRSRVYSFMSRKLMPPIGNLLVHEQALDLLRAWILELPGPPALAASPSAARRPGRRGRADRDHALAPRSRGRHPLHDRRHRPRARDAPLHRPFRVPPATTVRAAAFRPVSCPASWPPSRRDGTGRRLFPGNMGVDRGATSLYV